MKLINKLTSANALFFLVLLVPNQQYANANEPQKELLSVIVDNSNYAESDATKNNAMKEMKVATKTKAITKVKLNAKPSVIKLDKIEHKASLTVLIAGKKTPTQQNKSKQQSRQEKIT
ncbi:MAG: hypothetical protein MJK12_05995 [Colwellia sp.]|nr:hypothetical protein [Colwellia sp.]